MWSVESLLRQLLSDVGQDGAVCAYADHIALVVRDPSRLGRLAATFKAFERASASRLKPAKCVAVPLRRLPDGALPVERCKADLIAATPGWADMTVAGAAKYLGVCVGPAASLERIWKDPLGKAQARASLIADAAIARGVGLPLLSRRVLLVLTYTASLAVAPPELAHAGRRWVERVLHMPYNSVPIEVAGALRSFGHASEPDAEVHAARTLAAAAQRLRHEWEPPLLRLRAAHAWDGPLAGIGK